jgi:hypothetical protein
MWAGALGRLLQSLPLDERANPSVVDVVDALQRDLVELTSRASAGRVSVADVVSKTATLDGRLRVLERFAAAVTEATKRGVLVDAATDVDAARSYLVGAGGDEGAAHAAVLRVGQRAEAGVTRHQLEEVATRLRLRAGTVASEATKGRDDAEKAVVEAQKKFEDGAFAAARTLLNEARERWVVEVVRTVNRLPAQGPPVGPENASWQALRRDAEAFPRELSFEEVDRAATPLLRRFGLLLAGAVTAELGSAPDAGTAEARAATVKARQPLVDAVAALRRAVDGRDADGGMYVAMRADEVLAVRNALRALDPPTKLAALGRDGADRAEPAEPALSDIPLVGIVVTDNSAGSVVRGAPATVVVPDASSVQRRIDSLDNSVAAIAAAMAVVGGLAFLYGPNLGWGSSTDVLAMFLWAVGVHQVAGVTGSTAVRKVVEGGMKEAAA